jgi:glutaredoxin
MPQAYLFAVLGSHSQQQEGASMNTELRTGLVDLFREAGQAHHAAFAATNGDDPDWSIWYADYLQKPIAEQLDMKFHKSQLIYCLMNADFEHQARSPDSDWSEFYADQLLERCAPSETPERDKLILYHLSGCPFCALVLANIERLGIEVELREIYENSQFREELIEARGRATVPVLRINSPDGSERWMPESRDIVRYLEKTFAPE